MKSRKLWILALASALALSQAATAFADNGAGGIVSDAERAANGHTTISIMQAKVDPSNVSFTVPLYVTMAVVDKDDKVKVPDNYVIKNTTPRIQGKEQYQKIGVTNMSFERLAGASFNTVPYSTTVSGNDNIALSIGGVDMPELSTVGMLPVDIKATSARSGAVNKFWDTVGNKPKPIPVEGQAVLDLAGTVDKTGTPARDESKAVAQFRVKYTIALLQQDGTPMGTVYAGDDRTAAGMEPFVQPQP